MTGLLICTRCKAKIITDSIEQGRYKLDHSVGLYIGKPCGDKSDKNGNNPLLQFTDDNPVELLKKTDNSKKKNTKSKLD